MTSQTLWSKHGQSRALHERNGGQPDSLSRTDVFLCLCFKKDLPVALGKPSSPSIWRLPWHSCVRSGRTHRPFLWTQQSQRTVWWELKWQKQSRWTAGRCHCIPFHLPLLFCFSKIDFRLGLSIVAENEHPVLEMQQTLKTSYVIKHLSSLRPIYHVTGCFSRSRSKITWCYLQRKACAEPCARWHIHMFLFVVEQKVNSFKVWA